eukprot:3898659-Pyramimonas_sp.AAC.1
MRTPPLGPSAKLPLGPRSAVLGWGGAHANTASGAFGGAPMRPSVGQCSGVFGGGDACEHRHWGRRWSSRWGGHGALYWVWEAATCENRHRVL